MTPQNECYSEELLNDLIHGKISDMNNALDEIKFFNELYLRELYTAEKPENTLNIINNLKKEYENDERELHRFKNILDGNKGTLKRF